MTSLENHRLSARQQDEAKRRLSQYLLGKARSAESWLQSHLDFILLSGVALGFLIRAIVAGKTYLNPDEALHYLLANQRSLAVAYQASLTNPYPPFFFFVLYFWRFLGNSEFVLRLPSVLAGALFPWLAFKWLGEVLGKSAGLFALVLLEFSPTMIVLSAEVRGYALLLLFMASALYFFERAFRENSPRMMWAFSFFLYLSIVTLYTALWFTLALGAYALLRISSEPLTKKVFWIWAASQLGALAIYAFFYVTHISELRGSSIEHQTMSGWLSTFYFQFGRDRLLRFIVDRTVGVFQYAFSRNEVGVSVFILFLLGVGFLVVKNSRLAERAARSREFAILLLLPFVIGSAAGIARVYPYGGTRHDVYLVLFAVAGASALSTILPGRKLWPAFLTAVLIVAITNLDPMPVEFIRPRDQAKILMIKAVDDIHQSISPGKAILVEYQTSIMLRYYLCRDEIVSFDDPAKSLFEFRCGGYRLISTGPLLWSFTTENFMGEMEKMAKRASLNPGDRAWVVHAGWNAQGMHLRAELAARFPELNELPHRDFGANICLFQVRIGELRPPRAARSSASEDSNHTQVARRPLLRHGLC